MKKRLVVMLVIGSLLLLPVSHYFYDIFCCEKENAEYSKKMHEEGFPDERGSGPLPPIISIISFIAGIIGLILVAYSSFSIIRQRKFHDS